MFFNHHDITNFSSSPGDMMTDASRCITIALIALVVTGLAVCERTPVSDAASPVVQATSPEVLKRIKDLGGTYGLDSQGRVTVLSFLRCPLKDGDLEIVRSTPKVWTLNLRGVSIVGGTLTANGLQPIESLRHLQRLDLSYNRFSGRLEAIRSLSQLVFLDLRGTDCGDEAMETVTHLPRLRTLRTTMDKVTERGLRTLRGSSLEDFDFWRDNHEDAGLLGGLKKLKHWFIGFGSVPSDRLKEFQGMDQLEYLWISCHNVPCPEASIEALRSMHSLQTLEISGPTDADWPILDALDSLPNLKSLRLCSIGDRGLKQLPRLPSLESLDLYMNTEVSADGLIALHNLPALRHLALRPSRTSPESLQCVAECTQLETLVFHPNRICQTGDQLPQSYPGDPEPPPTFLAVDLRSVLKHAPLKRLDVDGLGFGDEIMEVAALGKHLENLGVSGLAITDAGLLQLQHLEHLTSLDVMGTQVTYEAAQTFQREFHPRCSMTDNWCCGCMALSPLLP